jgi:hypothetical protein
LILAKFFALPESRLRMAHDARLSILTTQEVGDLYGLPRFTEDDRRLHFDLSPVELETVHGVCTISVEVHLVLQLGDFKAKRQFFVFDPEAVTDDIEHMPLGNPVLDQPQQGRRCRIDSASTKGRLTGGSLRIIRNSTAASFCSKVC